MVNVSFNAESREFNGKWYTDLRAWKIESRSNRQSQPLAGSNIDTGLEPFHPGRSEAEMIYPFNGILRFNF